MDKETGEMKARSAAKLPSEVQGQQSQGQGMAVAILIALFLHLLFLWATPGGFFSPKGTEREAGPTLDLFLEEVAEDPEPPEQQYVQAPVNIPERKPDQTFNFSDRDQQAAQEESAPPDPLNNPAVDGDEPDSNRIVQGNPREEPTPPAPPVESPSTAVDPAPPLEAAPREEVVETPPEAVDQEAVTDEGILSVLQPDRSEEVPEQPSEQLTQAERSPFDGRGRDAATLEQQAAQEEAQTPRPRPRVERDTSFGPIRENRQGSIRIGRLAFDAQYSEFGEYWRRVAEVIEGRWRNLVYNTKALQFNRERVVIRFDITREGRVENLQVLHSGAGRLAETISIDAIVGEAPFFRWTPEMIVLMGESTTVQLGFIY